MSLSLTDVPPGDWFKFFGVLLAESFNWLLHASMYSLANPIGSDVFIVDALGLPEIALIENLTVGSLINGTLALIAVGVPVIGWFFLLTRRDILIDRESFFRDPVPKLIGGLLVLMYIFIIATELSALWLRIADELQAGAIPSFSGHSPGALPMVIISFALILANAGIGLATATVYKSLKSDGR